MKRSESAGMLARLAVVLGLAAGALGLAIPAASAARTTGWLRLAHLSPNTPPVDVYLYSFGDPSARVVLKRVGYGTVSGYQRVPTGEYTVAMRMPGAAATSKPVLSTTVNVAAGDAYTVAGMGPASGLRLQVFRDRLKTPRGKALVRIIQASMHQNAVTVSAGQKVIGRKLKFTTVTPYQALRPGDRTVRAVGESEHGSDQFMLDAGAIYTIVVMDDSGQLKVACLMDSAGSKVMPNGSAEMGFGGTAPRPGAPLLPWLGAAAAGLLAAAAGALRLRTRRRPALHAR